jgi:hypothetical protein
VARDPHAAAASSCRRGVRTTVHAAAVAVQVLGLTIDASYVHNCWTAMARQPPDAFLFDPAISALPTQLVGLPQWRHVDLWLALIRTDLGTHPA